MCDHPQNALIVGCDAATIESLTPRLSKFGFEPAIAADGAAAVSAYQRDLPQLVIVAEKTAGTSGLELCRWIRNSESERHVHILFVSASADAFDGALEAGADDFATTPLLGTKISARLRTARRLIDLESRISQHASIDELTGLATRRAFREAIDREWELRSRHDREMACVLVDIDFFKQFNDEHGHAAGDEVIRRTGRVLRAQCRAGDVVARYGGEEFALLLIETNEEGAVAWAERARTRLEAECFEFGGLQLRATASFGVAAARHDLETSGELIDAADQCLLAAKSRGRNCVVAVRHLVDADAEIAGEINESAMNKLQDTPVVEAMTPLIHFLRPNAPLTQAADYLRRFRLASAPVVGDDSELVGVVSERDILAIGGSPATSQRCVGDVMRESVLCFDEQTPISKVLNLMQRVSHRNLFITAEGKITGVVSRGSLISWCARSIWQAAPGEADDAWTSQEALHSAARRLVDEAKMLLGLLEPCKHHDSATPVLVGVTRMQDLLDELLAATPGLVAAMESKTGVMPIGASA